MSETPIISFDIDTTAFKEFEAEFAAFKSGMKEIPAEWAKIGKAIRKVAASDVGKVTVAITGAAKAQTGMTKAVAGSHRAMGGLLKTAGRVGHVMGGIVRSVLKIGGIVSLIGTGAGLFGMDRLADTANAQRMAAQAAGISIGRRRAFQINYGQAVSSPGALLQTIAEARTNPYDWRYFAGLGIANPAGTRTSRLAPEVVRRIREDWQRTHSLAYMQAIGATHFMSAADIMRVGNMSGAQFGRVEAGYSRDAAQLRLGRATQRGWQEFSIQLQRAGAVLETTIIRGLVPLTGPLSALSAEVVAAVRGFMGMPELRVWIKDFGHDIRDAAAWVKNWTKDGGPQRLDRALVAVAGAVETFGTALVSIAGWFRRTFPGAFPKTVPPGTVYPTPKQAGLAKRGPLFGQKYYNEYDIKNAQGGWVHYKTPGLMTLGAYEAIGRITRRDNIHSIHDLGMMYDLGLKPGTKLTAAQAQDLAAWVKNVSVTSGIKANAPIDLLDPATRLRVMSGVGVAEHGYRLSPRGTRTELLKGVMQRIAGAKTARDKAAAMAARDLAREISAEGQSGHYSREAARLKAQVGGHFGAWTPEGTAYATLRAQAASFQRRAAAARAAEARDNAQRAKDNAIVQHLEALTRRVSATHLPPPVHYGSAAGRAGAPPPVQSRQPVQ